MKKQPDSRGQHIGKTSLVGAIVAGTALLTTVAMGQIPLDILSFPDDSGVTSTFSTAGAFDTSNPFFQPLGQQFATTCEHCHFASDAESVSAAHARELFNSTSGQHPLFSAPTANDFHAALALGSGGSFTEREAAYSLMLNKGDALVRRNLSRVVGTSTLVYPAGYDFTVTAVVDPSLAAALNTICVDNGGQIVGTPPCAGSTPAIPGAAYTAYTGLDNGGVPQIWAHRRPLPTTNFKFLTTAAWDGRDTRQSPNPVTRPTIGECGPPTAAAGACSGGVADIARATIIGRMTGGSLKDSNGNVYSAAQLDMLANQLTSFMSSLFSAQDNVHGAGSLRAKGAKGGVVNLSKQLFYFGINDVLQGDLIVCGAPDNPAALEASLCAGQSPGTIVSTTNPVTPFTPVVFTEFNAWHQDPNPRRAAIERGQALFNATRLTISGVGGLNSVYDPGDGLCAGAGCPVQNGTLVLPNGSTASGVGSFPGSCGTCHDAPNVGDHSTRLPINIGIADKAPAGLGRVAVADLPLFIMTRNSDGAIAQTTDPGRAVISGQFAHIGQFKGPILHGMAARAPFFHNGMAATLEEVVDFYNERFNGQFTAHEKADLVAFLSAL